jgi:hypothetical protein
MTVLGTGGVLVCGGFNNTNWLSACHLYTPTTSTWTVYASLPQPLDQHAMVTLQGVAYVFGGENGCAHTRHMFMRGRAEQATQLGFGFLGYC